MTSVLSAARARELVARFGNGSVLIVGDVMLDHFVIGRVSRISPEAPVPVVEHDHDEYRIGGAGNVANNVGALGGAVELVGLIGEDRDAEILCGELRACQIGCSGLVSEPSRRTTTKQRIVTTRNQHVARVDYENDADAGPAAEQALMARVERHIARASVVVVSDYLKGVVTRGLTSRIVELARTRQVPVLIDPKIPHIDYYAGAIMVTPNHHEAEVATHMRIRSDEDATRAGRVFMERARCLSVLITRGEQGMSLVDPIGDMHFPAVAREVADVTGAGDTVIAALALSLAAGATRGEAAQLANHAAAIVVGHFGAATVTPAELLGSFSG
ncbi:MAG: D-glycero-beta-D-manno-heptose-7-phosphate kinase [Acidobacteria bacterium]|nr:D-glycero-beta-D-manno-heptose-7-phosphate kinase [Acidobacteriota bacterium]